jgi:AAA domain-containing protein/bifunctional DNA primase/polymerase-like protein
MIAAPDLRLVEPFNPDTAGPTDWVQMYRSFGIQVVPAYRPGEVEQWKRPCLSTWREYQHELARDEVFDGWYGPQGKYRTRESMGLLTGAASGGAFIVDLDLYKSPAAKTWWSNLLEVHNSGLEIETPKQRTGGGGIQLVFRAPQGWTSPTNKTPIGVDIRGQGGFAVLPPSPHLSGNHYAWVEDLAPWETKIATAPEWLCSEIDELVKKYGRKTQPTDNVAAAAPDSHKHDNVTAQPAFNDFGMQVDGREERMRDVVWAAVVNLRRKCPIKPTGQAAADEMMCAYDTYELGVVPQAPGDGGNRERLERENRGLSEFTKKWQYAMAKWDGDVAQAAANLSGGARADAARDQTRFDEATGAPRIKSSGLFVANFTPPDYIVDGLVQQGFLYSLTGATGAGKTCITLRLAASTALGVTFAKRETKKMRVLYLAAENPDDVRMRWTALSQHMYFDVNAIEVFFVEGAFKISQMAARLKQEATKIGGEFGLVIIDTGPVFYEGDDENNRTQQGKHAEMMRGLIDLIPGRPAVIVNCHPVKNAAADNLLPAGGGNFINQVDGNLTAAKSDSTTELHWQGKFRGVEFAPMHFMLRTVTHERLKDSKGRLIPTVISDWISDTAKEEIRAQKTADEDELLKHIAIHPKASQSDLAKLMGWKLFNGDPHKVKVGRCLKTLERAKLVKETRAGNYRLTPDGEKHLKRDAEAA